MSDDVLVRVENVSKRFCRSLKRSLWYGLQDLGSEIGGRRHGGGSGLPQSSADVQLRPDEFWAVKDVSFELRRGECLGLIGRNGAGKTTLLRMLNGLIKPDTGRIETRGRIGALIALGAGFNPLLTGRENVYTNASILGLSRRQTAEMLDEIVGFAELEDFIDTPVQSYSSGMQVRLGFSIATSLDCDILLLDEVLAVGDVKFQAKCFTRISKIKKDKSIVFISHSNSNLSRLCELGLILQGGLATGTMGISDALSFYLNQDLKKNLANPIQKISAKAGESQLVITQCNLECYTSLSGCFMHRNAVKVTVRIKNVRDVERFILDIVFRLPDGTARLECPLLISHNSISADSETEIIATIDPIPLPPGAYQCALFAIDDRCLEHYDIIDNVGQFIVSGLSLFTGPVQIAPTHVSSKRL